MVFHICKPTNLNPALETKILNVFNRRRPADISVSSRSQGSHPAEAVSFTTANVSNQTVVAASGAEKHTIGQFDNHCRRIGVLNFIFAIEKTLFWGNTLTFSPESWQNTIMTVTLGFYLYLELKFFREIQLNFTLAMLSS